MRTYHQFYIDGQWVAPVNGGQRWDVINPATEDVAGTILLGDADDVERAVLAAHRAFAGYARTPLAQRIALLEAIAQQYELRLDDLAAAISEEMGAPCTRWRGRRRRRWACGICRRRWRWPRTTRSSGSRAARCCSR